MARFLPLWCFLVLVPAFIWSQDLGAIKKQQPFKVSGTVTAQYIFYSSTGPSYLQPGSWMISGSPVLNIYGVAVPLSFTFSEKERSFRQPLNNFGLSPYYKWLTLHLGFRNLTFSEYSLNGHQMLGVGAEIKNLKKIHFGVMYGRLMRPIEPRPDDMFEQYQTPAYRRKGIAFTAGYGGEKNKIDVFLFQADDDANSLKNQLLRPELKAGSNRVMGAKTHNVLLKHFTLDAEWATSETQYTNAGTQAVNTEKGSAIDAKMGFNNQRFRMMIKYLRIAPGFESFGRYFFQRDVRNITFDPGADFFEKKLSLDLSLGFQRDQLDQNKAYKTERRIFSGKVTARPWKFYTFNLTAGNYSIDQQKGLYEPDPLLRISQANFNLTAMNQFMQTFKNYTHFFNVVYAAQRLSDNNANTSKFSEFEMNTWSLMYSATLPKIMLTATATYMSSAYRQQLINTRIAGPLFSINKSFKKKVSFSLSWADRSTNKGLKKTHQTSTISIAADFKFYKRHRIGLRYTYNDQQSFVSGVSSFHENRGDISYAFTF